MRRVLYVTRRGRVSGHPHQAALIAAMEQMRVSLRAPLLLTDRRGR